MLKFSTWSKFDKRADFNNAKYPAVYALAISNVDISGQPFGYIKEIAYFGMTNSRGGIRQRLDQFNNTLRGLRGPGHGGAERFVHKYKDGNELAKRLYVAICPFKCDVKSIARKDLIIMGAVARAEYIAWAEYCERFSCLPEFNDKARSPKTSKARSKLAASETRLPVLKTAEN